jgi:hypothetical protein
MPLPLPYAPEPLASLQARYKRAIDCVYDLGEVKRREIVSPGGNRENVFDFEDGLRLIVSRTQKGESRVVFMVTAGWMTPPTLAADQWPDTIPERYAELSGDTEPIDFFGWHDKFPHWCRIETFPP